jgi:hypothetical protein
MSYFVGAMLVLQRASAVSRHTNHSEWHVIDCIDFDSANNDNMNLLTTYATKCILVPVRDVKDYNAETKRISRQFDPTTSTTLWQAQH